jgi:hypothetical protein
LHKSKEQIDDVIENNDGAIRSDECEMVGTVGSSGASGALGIRYLVVLLFQVRAGWQMLI